MELFLGYREMYINFEYKLKDKKIKHKKINK